MRIWLDGVAGAALRPRAYLRLSRRNRPEPRLCDTLLRQPRLLCARARATRRRGAARFRRDMFVGLKRPGHDAGAAKVAPSVLNRVHEDAF